MWLALKYTFFAIISIIVNILSQDLVVQLYSGILALYLSIGFGTLTGLIVKYILDKKYIFSFTASNMIDDGKKFILYSSMGVVTTLVFWGTELGFEFLFATKFMRYMGAIIGLTNSVLSFVPPK